MFLSGTLKAEFWKGQHFLIPRTTSAPSHSTTSELPHTDNRKHPHSSPKHSQELLLSWNMRQPRPQEPAFEARKSTDSHEPPPQAAPHLRLRAQHNGSQYEVLVPSMKSGLAAVVFTWAFTRNIHSRTPCQSYPIRKSRRGPSSLWFHKPAGVVACMLLV